MQNQNPPLPPTITAAAFGGFIAGAVTGATITTARLAKKIHEKKISPKQAAAEILSEAGTLGLATSIGASTTASLKLRGILSIAGLALVTTSAKYALDNVLAEKLPRHKAVEQINNSQKTNSSATTQQA